VVLVAVALVVVAPALRSEPRDGFPLSSYPMFSHDRGRIAAIGTAVGLDGDGVVHRLGPHAVGGGDEVMLAASAARRAIGAGPEAAARYCDEVAARVDDDDLVAVEVRTEVRDAIDDVAADDPPIDVEVHARCEVPG
jgi:hypothetical protein